MPYIDIRLAGTALTPAQRDELFAGTTELVSTLLGKRREVTAVSIHERARGEWAVGGSALRPEDGPGAYVEIKVTQGSNTALEMAAAIAATSALLQSLLGPMPVASYVTIHEIPADAWGYDGLTQAARKAAPPTLRRLAGAQPPAALDPAASALLLVDFQMEYFAGRLPLPDSERAAATAARLVEWADRCGMAVVHVQHVNAPGAALFPADDPRVAFLPMLAPGPAHGLVTKKLPSAFAGTGLDQRLKSAGIDTLVLCGLMTHTCVSSTARDALSLGYQCIVAGDACATRDLPDRSGGVVPHRDVQRANLAALADRFADVVESASIMGLAAA